MGGCKFSNPKSLDVHLAKVAQHSLLLFASESRWGNELECSFILWFRWKEIIFVIHLEEWHRINGWGGRGGRKADSGGAQWDREWAAESASVSLCSELIVCQGRDIFNYERNKITAHVSLCVYGEYLESLLWLVGECFVTTAAQFDCQETFM